MTECRGDLVALVPCRNEESSIARVIDDLRSIGVTEILVGLDPASSDATAQIASARGASVVISPASGYDAPCLAGLEHLRSQGYRGSVLFLDAGNKYVMSTVGDLLDAVDPAADITLGVRDSQWHWHQRFGNGLFRTAVRIRFRHRLLDVSSLRVMNMDVLNQLNLEDRQFSLPFQTVLHALAREMTLQYVPIRCTPTRSGSSKVSGLWRNSLKAGRQMGLSFFRIR